MLLICISCLLFKSELSFVSVNITFLIQSGIHISSALSFSKHDLYNICVIFFFLCQENSLDLASEFDVSFF